MKRLTERRAMRESKSRDREYADTTQGKAVALLLTHTKERALFLLGGEGAETKHGHDPSPRQVTLLSK